MFSVADHDNNGHIGFQEFMVGARQEGKRTSAQDMDNGKQAHASHRNKPKMFFGMVSNLSKYSNSKIIPQRRRRT
jgi:hypothetical protein